MVAETGQSVVGDLVISQVFGLELEQLNIGHLVLQCHIASTLICLRELIAVLPLNIHVHVHVDIHIYIDIGVSVVRVCY